MIPKLIPNENFYKTLAPSDIPWFKNLSEPYEEFLDNSVLVYKPHVEDWVGKERLFTEYNHAYLDDWGFCPSVYSLTNFLRDHIESETTNYLVTAKLVYINNVLEDETYGTYIDESGESSDMSLEDFIEEYGLPITQYMDMVILFNIFKLQ